MNDSPPQGYLPPLPQTPAPLPMFGAAPTPGQKPKRQSFFPTFLGGGSSPETGQVGQKTLLGGAT